MSFQKLATYFKSWIENVRRICCRILYVTLSSGGKKKMQMQVKKIQSARKWKPNATMFIVTPDVCLIMF